MNLKSISASVCLTTGALLSFSISAHAITFTTGGRTVANEGLYTNETAAGTRTINFNTVPNGTPPFSPSYTDGFATFTQDANGLLIRNSTQTVGATTATPTGGYAPAGDTSRVLITGGYYDQGNTGYTSTGNTASGISTFHDSINISFGTIGINYFGLYWGLINASNQIQFYSSIDGTGNPLNTTTIPAKNGSSRDLGQQVTGNELPDFTENSSNYVNFFTDTGETIRSVRLTNVGSTSGNPGNGFEVDNISYRPTVVPWTPSPILNLLGLASLGVVIGLKRKLRNSKLLNQLPLKSKLELPKSNPS